MTKVFAIEHPMVGCVSGLRCVCLQPMHARSQPIKTYIIVVVPYAYHWDFIVHSGRRDVSLLLLQMTPHHDCHFVSAVCSMFASFDMPFA